MAKKVYLYLENGAFFIGESFGADGSECGEIVFNTSLSGYQEITSDPSYAGQFVVFSMPEIGIVGINNQDSQSLDVPHTKGIIVRNYNDFYSNFRANESLGDYLKKNGIMGISNINTRLLVKMIRQSGAMMMIASTKHSNPKKLKEILESSKRIEEIDYISQVSTKAAFRHNRAGFDFGAFEFKKPNFSKKIAVIDFGVKQNILDELSEVGLECEVVDSKFSADLIIQKFRDKKIGGVFLSNGPGNPAILKSEIKEIKKLIDEKIPMFGICLGHQLLSLAHGYPTYKLDFGHHGGNHPVKNLLTNKVEITAQNHIYSVPENITEIAEVTHINLFDGTIEGVRYKNAPIISLQHHPEASPGPREATAVFREFYQMVRECD